MGLSSKEGEGRVIEVLIFGNCYAHEPKIRERFLRAEASRGTNEFTGDRNYHLFLRFSMDNWIRIVFLPLFCYECYIYIYIICSDTYDQEMYGKKDSFLIENLLRYVSFFFFTSESSRRFHA